MKFGGTLLLALALAGTAQAAKPGAYGTHPEARRFISEMVARHEFRRSELEFLFQRARRRDDILRAITPRTGSSARGWLAYRDLFVNRTRIEGGLAFWSANAAELARAEAELGVPAEIMVAIIGIETLYGRQTGRHRVIDALSTLAFDYPPRAEFFRAELEQFLLYARDADLDVFSLRGSYAGAFGIPQFMPGSIRRHALDFDGSGAIDLSTSAVDALGSVANFLVRHGWRRGEPIWKPAQVLGPGHRALLERGIEPRTAIETLPEYGVHAATDLPPGTPVALIDLESPGAATEYRLGLRNFYVLTRYNRSSKYASAVSDLAVALRDARAAAR